MEKMIVVLLCAFVGPFLIYFMLREKTSSKIRKSKWWPIATLAFIQIVALTLSAWSVILDMVGVQLPTDEHFLMILLGVGMLIATVLFVYNIYLPYRKLKNDC